MRKQFIRMQTLISNNKQEILTDKKEVARIERLIEDKHNKRLQTNNR
ncbi:FbpB family small basic protein [Robertmurraya yapensis]|uniref:FbpB family small basic protein n=3 Tax=Bacillaceae TaxID=186817 RepID=A0A431VV84_9BACI|nr:MULTISPECIES: FbpB family small basic protein [Bacillaceae]RTR27142.1 FbpB family small basic protein [Bacillus yapensis]TKC19436.1 FbpB family small basic protein [Robertmurraya kyonggiensis]TKS93989.1 FbpB family small basic protein [Bacillus yapensis]